ncbi:NlpC/P60 family protein [Rhizobium halophytocola]|uniref:NlpC/P60 family putative phage cell wall peptidase n=1 Tax=Rhizobium halophytocola TaxID=735519 RepID=A0ABS4DYY3_9HYPH|nr:NlpC/P60 family protein [Rhizobium halophytocola]MBP1850898.1 NlpC/P60 family putative phage cell wall peptidase [Rhizobium halophytocola]
MTEPLAGARVVDLARDWIGTPYRHQGTAKSVGCDCLGLIRGLWRELYGDEPETPGPYAADWAERGGSRENGGGERLLDAASRHLVTVDGLGKAEAGDVLIFRFRAGLPARHCGVLEGPSHFIHAYEQAGVVRSALVPGWRRRVAGVFRFPAG